MPELVELYSRRIKEQLENYWAAWLPSTQFSVGDVGTLNGYVFEKVATLDQLGLKYYEVPSSDPSPFELTSGSDVTLSFKLKGETNEIFKYVAAADAGLKIEFGTQGAFVLQAPATVQSELGDRPNLQFQICKAYAQGAWEKDWLVVTRVISAPTASVLISRSMNSSLELSAAANLSGVVAALGAADSGIAITHQTGDTLSIIAGRKMTPLFQLSRLKTSFFGKPKFSMRSMRADDPTMVDLTPDLAREDSRIRTSLVFETLKDDELIGE